MGEMKKKGAAPNKSFFRRIAESEFFHNYKRSPSAILRKPSAKHCSTRWCIGITASAAALSSM